MSGTPLITAPKPPSEEREQARVIKWSHLVATRSMMPELRWLFHVPNGGKRTALVGAQMKAMGVKPGVPDLLLPVWREGSAGLALEMKTAIGRLSTEQNDWKHHFESEGWQFRVARSAQEARTILCAYLGMAESTAPPLAS